jgi:hypothetical protein
MSATATGLWHLGTMELAGAITSRQVSSQEVIDAPTILLADQALEAATAVAGPTGMSPRQMEGARDERVTHRAEHEGRGPGDDGNR